MPASQPTSVGYTMKNGEGLVYEAISLCVCVLINSHTMMTRQGVIFQQQSVLSVDLPQPTGDCLLKYPKGKGC